MTTTDNHSIPLLLSCSSSLLHSSCLSFLLSFHPLLHSSTLCSILLLLFLLMSFWRQPSNCMQKEKMCGYTTQSSVPENILQQLYQGKCQIHTSLVMTAQCLLTTHHWKQCWRQSISQGTSPHGPPWFLSWILIFDTALAGRTLMQMPCHAPL